MAQSHDRLQEKVSQISVFYCPEMAQDHNRLREKVSQIASSLSAHLSAKATRQVVESLQLLDSFLVICPQDMDLSLCCDDIIQVTLASLRYYDTNLANAYIEDISWKVRSAAAKCLTTVVVSQPQMRPKLQAETLSIFDSISGLLDENSIKTKLGAFAALKELVAVLPDFVDARSLTRQIQKALIAKRYTSNLKIEALRFSRLVLASDLSSRFLPYINEDFTSAVLSAVEEKDHKVRAEALRVCKELVQVLGLNLKGPCVDFKQCVRLVYEAVVKRLTRLTDYDQVEEVECAISCMEPGISTFGDILRQGTLLRGLVDRMGNKITRITAVKAFAVIATSSSVDMSPVLEDVIDHLTGFLEKNDCPLRHATLKTLDSLVIYHGKEFKPWNVGFIEKLPPLLNSGSDLHTLALALELCTLMRDRVDASAIESVFRDQVYPSAIKLVGLLHGRALLALQNFLKMYMNTEDTFWIVFEDLLTPSLLDLKCHSNAGQSLALLCLSASDDQYSEAIKVLKQRIPKSGDLAAIVALRCLGEIGRRKDLSSDSEIEHTIIACFSRSCSEEYNLAAAYALGNIAVGNLQKYLRFILDEIDKAEIKKQLREQYFLLHSLKEVFVGVAADKSELDDLWADETVKLLLDRCESWETVDILGECLGKLALIKPEKLLPALKKGRDCGGFTKAAILTTLKSCMVDGVSLILDSLPGLFEHLYNQEGSDDGQYELRKTAFECVDTCLEQVTSFIVPYLISGLDDHRDVKIPCHRILIKLADICPAVVLEVLDSIVDPLQKTINSQPRQDTQMEVTALIISALRALAPRGCTSEGRRGAQTEEADRHEDMIRSALRAIASLDRISEGRRSIKFNNLMVEMSKNAKLQEEYSSIALSY